MAILRKQDGTITTNLEAIAQELAPLQVKLNLWPIDPATHQLLAKEALAEEEKEQVLQALDPYFQQLKENEGYESRDLIVLHPHTPNLDSLLAKFNGCHTHADDEVRYLLDGEGVFGFVLPNGSQVELTIQPEEYINVPAGTEHWFHLTETRRVKAVRFFTTTAGWIPEYTATKILFPLT
ncbi:MAG: acireductone dioxygenase [Gomphosphaeria aponina SAG 52.96 = DSM 107014]|uniref:Acireductone dioxygenase n=1 Tax=Gomphosphaeria aponina SAG 52.96 = DSM 107014 TaxID=1521640 RepID=A0A941GXC6_9CHRO|nr:acireductone dioxygenase [Gomphosphaeria aponina SAG 52.96 = DSM 107014]